MKKSKGELKPVTTTNNLRYDRMTLYVDQAVKDNLVGTVRNKIKPGANVLKFFTLVIFECS